MKFCKAMARPTLMYGRPEFLHTQGLVRFKVEMRCLRKFKDTPG